MRALSLAPTPDTFHAVQTRLGALGERDGSLELLHRLIALEYALIEACHADRATVHPRDQAVLAAHAATAKEHLFRLASLLRELGDVSFLQSRCGHLALMQGGSAAEVLLRVTRAYEQALTRHDLGASTHALLFELLRAHTPPGLRAR